MTKTLRRNCTKNKSYKSGRVGPVVARSPAGREVRGSNPTLD